MRWFDHGIHQALPGVVGLGVDLVETDRMKESIAKWGDRFTRKVFADTERSYCDSRPEPWRHYAGRFAVKEAVSKAFGTGIGKHLGWLDIIVLRSRETGAPYVEFSREGRIWTTQRNITRVLVSLSHTRRYAMAQAIVIGREPGAGAS